MSDEVDMLHPGKHESFLQIDSIGMVKNSQSSQNSKFAMSLQYLQKEVKTEVDFLHVEFPKNYFNTWSIKVCCKVNITLLTGMITCFQITQRS